MNTVSLGIITSTSVQSVLFRGLQLRFYKVFLVLRTYALYYRRSWVLVITVPLGIMNVALAAVRDSFPGHSTCVDEFHVDSGL